jgi:hypothetical protein
MMRGEDPSSLCKLIAAGAKSTISVEVTEGHYSSTNRKLLVVRLVAKSVSGCQ